MLKRSLCLLLVMLAVMNLWVSPAFAESNVGAAVQGSSANSVAIQVSTAGSKLSAKPYIELTQTKGTMKIFVLRLDGNDYTTNKAMYEYYVVTLFKLNNGKYKQQGKPIKWEGTKNLKIKLDKNSKYLIAIEPYAVLYSSDYKFGPAMSHYPFAIFPFKVWSPRGWVKDCTWKLSSSSKIKSCKILG